MNLTKKEVLIVIILAFMTGLIALSIDMYLPSFKAIATDLGTDMGKVQVSLSVFLGGLALGQLLWGTLSDRMGRKLPTIIATVIYCIASLLVLTTTSIEQIWFYRFVQAFCGSAGMVIARAVVTDYFEKERTTGIFSVLTLITGVAPIVAPIMGNSLLELGGWHTVFIAMGILGALTTLLVAFMLPETHKTQKKPANYVKKERTVLGSYLHVLRNKQFFVYMLIGSVTYGALMVYISNSPFLIMEKGGFTGTQYSLIFALNAVGMMLGAFIVNPLLKRISIRRLVQYACVAQTVIAILLIFAVTSDLPILPILVLLFFFLLLIGLLSPTTTDLALEPFHNDSGTASAAFGFMQQAFTFLLSGFVGLIQNNSIIPMATTLLVCAFIAMASSVMPVKKKELDKQLIHSNKNNKL